MCDLELSGTGSMCDFELRLEWVGHPPSNLSSSKNRGRCNNHAELCVEKLRRDFERHAEVIFAAAQSSAEQVALCVHNDTLGEDAGVGLNLCSNV